jgi:hypothetical protein
VNETSEPIDLIREEYRKLDNDNVEWISTSMLADAVYARIDGKRAAPLLVKVAAILELKQLARAVCRDRQMKAETDAESQNLFDFQLQPRYPAEREGEDTYVLRAALNQGFRRNAFI